MIAEDFCSYEVAKLLKEKGFDEPCDNYYNKKGSEKQEPQELTWDEIMYSYDEFLKAPTHQMAMKWLREVHKIFIVIIPRLFYSDGSCDSFAYSIWADDNLDVDGEEEWDELYESYEDAVEAAIKYCLENLI